MKVAVISDIHDNLPNLEKCLDWCRDNSIPVLVCCGDVTNADTLSYISENFDGPIHLVRGNMELFSAGEADNHQAKGNFHYHGRQGCFQAGEKTIAFCHEPFLIEGAIGRCRESLQKNPDIVFYGHTHKPWIEEQDGIKAANPGTLGGVFAKATFAVYDSASEELKLILLEKLPKNF